MCPGGRRRIKKKVWKETGAQNQEWSYPMLQAGYIGLPMTVQAAGLPDFGWIKREKKVKKCRCVFYAKKIMDGVMSWGKIEEIL